GRPYVAAHAGVDRLGAIEGWRLLERLLEALGHPDLARLDEGLDPDDVAQEPESAPHGDGLSGAIALEADAPVVHRDPDLRLARRLVELDLDALRHADRLARASMQQKEGVAVLLNEHALRP